MNCEIFWDWARERESQWQRLTADPPWLYEIYCNCSDTPRSPFQMQINPDRWEESFQLISVQSISYSEFGKWLNMRLYDLLTSLSPNQSVINELSWQLFELATQNMKLQYANFKMLKMYSKANTVLVEC